MASSTTVHTSSRAPRRQIRPNAFGIAFGIVGLAEAWAEAEPTLGTPHVIPNVLNILAAVVWTALLVAYASQGPRHIMADLRDRVFGPFVTLPSIVGLFLAASLSEYAFDAGRVLVVVFVVITIGLGGWITGHWIAGDLDPDFAHPGYFLPTVAGGFIAAYACAQVNLHSLAQATFGSGVLSWLLIGSLILNRLFFRPALPTALLPTLAIEVGPPAVAGIAYIALTGGATDTIAYGLTGYTILMALVQLRLAPIFVRLRFSPAFWSFAFVYSAVAAYALLWIGLTHPAGATVYATVLLTAITAFVVAIGARTLVAVWHGEFFPLSPPEPAFESPPNGPAPAKELSGSQ
jgi:tellurite resistance protein